MATGINPYPELTRIIASAAEYVGYALAEIRRLVPGDGDIEDKVYDAFLHLRDAEGYSQDQEQWWDKFHSEKE